MEKTKPMTESEAVELAIGALRLRIEQLQMAVRTIETFGPAAPKAAIRDYQLRKQMLAAIMVLRGMRWETK